MKQAFFIRIEDTKGTYLLSLGRTLAKTLTGSQAQALARDLNTLFNQTRLSAVARVKLLEEN